jgi:hypothetical protein
MRIPTAVDSPASLTQHVAPLEVGARVIGMAWLKTQLAMALTDGRVLMAPSSVARATGHRC